MSITYEDKKHVFYLLRDLFKNLVVSLEGAIYQVCRETHTEKNLLTDEILPLSMQFIGDYLNDMYHKLHNKEDQELNEAMDEIRSYIYFHNGCFSKMFSYMLLSIYYALNRKNLYLVNAEDLESFDPNEPIEDIYTLPNEYYKRIIKDQSNDIESLKKITEEKFRYKQYLESVECEAQIVINSFRDAIIEALIECEDECKTNYDPKMHPLELVLKKIEENKKK